MIYDTFLYYGGDADRRLLALRLAETAAVVDRWVLVEATTTFSGQPKPLHYATEVCTDPAIAPYADRIGSVHAIVPRHGSTWAREHAQRAAISEGLHAAGVTLDDWVLVSDLDEIPSANAIQRVLQADAPGVYMFAQRLSYYYANCHARQQPWFGTRMARWRDIPNTAVLRLLGGHTVSNGGWHLSYLGGVAAIQDKIGAYSHQELNRPEFTDPAHIGQAMAESRDLFGRPGMHFRVAPLDSSYPAAMLADTEAATFWFTQTPAQHLQASIGALPASFEVNARQEMPL